MAEPVGVERTYQPPAPGQQGEPPAEPVEAHLYIVTGTHGLFTVPESFCRECNMFVRAVDQGAAQVDFPVEVKVLSWWGRVLGALFHGGYHAPVLVIEGQRIAQGYDVPTPERVAQALRAAAGEKG